MAAEKHTEIEAKLRVSSLEPVVARLKELGAQWIGEHHQEDDYFDSTQGELAGSDRCLRLRDETCDNQQRLIITYKGPKQKGAYKRRQEIELSVTDPESARLLFTALGYKPVLVVRKSRQVWQFNQCEVGLDTLPDLGQFVEIEGPDEAIIEEVQAALGLSDCSHEPESYACLLAKKQKL